MFLCVCVLQQMCSAKTAASVPSVWRIWCRERPSPGWPACVSTTRGNHFTFISVNQGQTWQKKGEGWNANHKMQLWFETVVLNVAPNVWWFPDLKEAWCLEEFLSNKEGKVLQQTVMHNYTILRMRSTFLLINIRLPAAFRANCLLTLYVRNKSSSNQLISQVNTMNRSHYQRSMCNWLQSQISHICQQTVLELVGEYNHYSFKACWDSFPQHVSFLCSPIVSEQDECRLAEAWNVPWWRNLY